MACKVDIQRQFIWEPTRFVGCHCKYTMKCGSGQLSVAVDTSPYDVGKGWSIHLGKKPALLDARGRSCQGLCARIPSRLGWGEMAGSSRESRSSLHATPNHSPFPSNTSRLVK